MSEDSSHGPLPSCPGGGEGADADALVRFGATRDRMKLCVSCYTPAKGRGRPLSEERVLELLDESGIKGQVDREAVAEAVRLLLEGQDARGVTIARGRKPSPARDAWVEPLGDLRFPVLHGQAFGRVHAPLVASEGLNLAGETVPPPDLRRPREIGVAPGGHCALAPDGTLTAQTYGLAHITDTQVLVEPLLAVDPDRLAVRGTLHPRDFTGAPLEARFIEDELSRMGVAIGLRPERIRAALEKARAAGAAVENVVLAKGTPPEHGTDAWLELFFTEQDNVGTEDDHGRMDYRDRGEIPVIEEGHDIARLHLATGGSPGQDVFGEEVPPRPGKPLTVKPGRNVETDEGGLLFRARMTGVVVHRGGVLDVSQLLDVGGDVDFNTGNVKVLQGSVHIKGTVRSGFEVAAPHNVVVDGLIENARVLAGGDVTVRGGVFMAGGVESFIKAGGAVSAAYTHNARILAAGDVTVAHYITASTADDANRVRSGGFVRVTDAKGRIMGGTVICSEGLEAYEAGSEMGLTTVLVVSRDSPEVRALIQEKRELKEFVAKVDKIFGTADVPEAALARLPEERRGEALALLERRRAARERLPRIGRSLAELAASNLDTGSAPRILIKGLAHAGVVIKMGGRSLILDRTLERPSFTWDPQKKEIVTG